MARFHHLFAPAVATLLVLAATTPVHGESDDKLYLELWQPPVPAEETPARETPVETEVDADAGEQEPPEAAEPAPRPGMFLVVGESTVATPIADWCEGLRRQDGNSVLAEALLRGATYERFATDSVPLLVEVLIDDVEMRYALGTERPAGASGTSFPFFEVCAVGFGARRQEEWVLDVLHLMNHRGDSMALGLYKGALPESERTYLESQLGYPAELPDPAGLLLLGSDRDIDTLLLVESPSSDAFDALRERIMR